MVDAHLCNAAARGLHAVHCRPPPLRSPCYCALIRVLLWRCRPSSSRLLLLLPLPLLSLRPPPLLLLLLVNFLLLPLRRVASFQRQLTEMLYENDKLKVRDAVVRGC